MNWQATTLAAGDNVATVLQPIAAGETVAVWTAAGVIAITALEPVALCHKIALADLATGTAVIKYGQCIGQTTTPVRQGGWVHVHNLRSRRAQAAGGAT
ncbi:MAG: UxaA family hydrolase [Betaproteobacteria bacterium]|nr:UxaA family hydrolase [Betaproteobacteria bacterium]